jgi:hypothetical protein
MLLTSIDYAKKKEKRAQIKFIKDETVQPPNGDIYKSHIVHVPTGEPPSSASRPAAKRKAGVVRPITQGKLLRPGGPSSSANVCVAIIVLFDGLSPTDDRRNPNWPQNQNPPFRRYLESLL